ncbi:hypothetical protein PPTG_18953 [Phytophthora nicotianae INRA-310]|uniref:DUF4833 domain-containing protein n=1 Tax=Phytophthora nicotianae (strain INRA-310) TaxID=761204 RepID=W2PEY3_PHYN3|nr:hypothetical protein PPTG_18953 [Phytophthora nicotianae INRA-310]ETM99215.1 hypothetical protein PPTG_18953 [Phytophthora nicotianae INRA-310]
MLLQNEHLLKVSHLGPNISARTYTIAIHRYITPAVLDGRPVHIQSCRSISKVVNNAVSLIAEKHNKTVAHAAYRNEDKNTVVDAANIREGSTLAFENPLDVNWSMFEQDGNCHDCPVNRLTDHEYRRTIGIAKKQEAIKWIGEQGGDVASRAAPHFRKVGWDVDASTFRKWRRNKEE